MQKHANRLFNPGCFKRSLAFAQCGPKRCGAGYHRLNISLAVVQRARLGVHKLHSERANDEGAKESSRDGDRTAAGGRSDAGHV